MKKTKEAYRQAVNQIHQILGEPGISASLQREGVQALDQIDRFVGELRRDVATLHRQHDRPTRASHNPQESTERGNAALAHAKKEACKFKEEREQWERHCSELQTEIERNTLPDLGIFTLVKVKCLACGLHFIVCTEYPDQHTIHTLHCPECGQHDGHYLVWQEPGRGFIFQHVPGKAARVGSDETYDAQRGTERNHQRSSTGLIWGLGHQLSAAESRVGRVADAASHRFAAADQPSSQRRSEPVAAALHVLDTALYSSLGTFFRFLAPGEPVLWVWKGSLSLLLNTAEGDPPSDTSGY